MRNFNIKTSEKDNYIYVCISDIDYSISNNKLYNRFYNIARESSKNKIIDVRKGNTGNPVKYIEINQAIDLLNNYNCYISEYKCNANDINIFLKRIVNGKKHKEGVLIKNKLNIEQFKIEEDIYVGLRYLSGLLNDFSNGSNNGFYSFVYKRVDKSKLAKVKRKIGNKESYITVIEINTAITVLNEYIQKSKYEEIGSKIIVELNRILGKEYVKMNDLKESKIEQNSEMSIRDFIIDDMLFVSVRDVTYCITNSNTNSGLRDKLKINNDNNLYRKIDIDNKVGVNDTKVSLLIVEINFLLNLLDSYNASNANLKTLTINKLEAIRDKFNNNKNESSKTKIEDTSSFDFNKVFNSFLQTIPSTAKTILKFAKRIEKNKDGIKTYYFCFDTEEHREFMYKYLVSMQSYFKNEIENIDIEFRRKDEIESILAEYANSNNYGETGLGKVSDSIKNSKTPCMPSESIDDKKLVYLAETSSLMPYWEAIKLLVENNMPIRRNCWSKDIYMIYEDGKLETKNKGTEILHNHPKTYDWEIYNFYNLTIDNCNTSQEGNEAYSNVAKLIDKKSAKEFKVLLNTKDVSDIFLTRFIPVLFDYSDNRVKIYVLDGSTEDKVLKFINWIKLRP